MASDPMIYEKGTDPKMHDMATDAWKRDGGVQTTKKSHEGSLQIRKSVEIIMGSILLGPGGKIGDQRWLRMFLPSTNPWPRDVE